ncbi:hypothetical protein PybrP1_006703 [[Pythium] brassicae (nom. inval.)]|nr:hypothetical protein PybrP1_006703 [[Pythium] brassicae (nom. inval.)]
MPSAADLAERGRGVTCDERNHATVKAPVTQLFFGKRSTPMGAGWTRRFTASAEKDRESLELMCRLVTKSKFKLVLFRAPVKKAKCTTAGRWISSDVALTDLNEVWPPHMAKRTVPLGKSDHHFCVYGDNWLSAVKYSIKCMKIDNEHELVCIKDDQTAPQKDFTAVKQVFEEVLGRV